MNKYEQLIDLIINENTEEASKLFHTIVVEKSREIYESLIDEEDFNETMGGDQVADLVDEVSADEDMQEMHEEEDELADMEDLPVDDEEMIGDEEMMGDEESAASTEEIEDRVVDLEDALDELKAEFDRLMAGEAGEEEHSDMDDEEHSEEMPENMVREYVEKAPAPVTSEISGTNTKSNFAGKNDMGGTAVKTGSSADEKGRTAPTAKPIIGKVGNTPGGSKDMSPATKPTTSQATGVNVKSPIGRK